MNTACLWIVTALYAVQTVISAASGNWPATAIVAGYAIAGVGLIWSLR